MDTSELLESLFDAIPDVIGIQDRHHGIIRYNAAGYKFLNMTHKETEGKKCYELIGRSTPCDIWNCGRHRVMCGDSTSHANLQLLLDGGKADMVFTDPPYLMNFTGSPPSKTGGKRVIVFTYPQMAIRMNRKRSMTKHSMV